MSTYMTLEEYAATLKVGDEVTIKYYSITGIAFVKKKPFCPKYGEMVYYVTVSGYI